MTACRNKASRAVTAALVGVLSVGAVPMVALAQTGDTGASLLATTTTEGINAGSIATFEDGHEAGATFVANGNPQGLVPDLVQPWPNGSEQVESTGYVVYKIGDKDDPTDANLTVDGEKLHYVAGSRLEDTLPTGIGDYAVFAKVNGTAVYAGARFSIVAADLNDATFYEVKTDANDLSDEEFVFDNTKWEIDGSKLGIKIGDDKLSASDFDIEYYDSEDKLLSGAPTAAGTYSVVLTGKSGVYNGKKATIEYTVAPLDLFAASVVIPDVAKEATGVNKPDLTKVTINGTTYDSTWLATYTNVAYTNLPTDTGEATITITPNEKALEADNLSGSIVKSAVKTYAVVDSSVKTEAKYDGNFFYTYSSDPLDVDFSADPTNAFDESKVVVNYIDPDTGKSVVTDKYQLRVTNVDSGEVGGPEMLTERGTYTVVAVLDAAGLNYEFCGESNPMKVTVTKGTIDSADVAFTYKGKLTSGLTGSSALGYIPGYDALDDIAVAVKTSTGKELAESEYQVVVTNSDGDEVESIEDADTYTITVKAEGYTLTGGNSIEVTVNPRNLDSSATNIRPKGTFNYSSYEDTDNDGHADKWVEHRVLTYTGEVLAPSYEWSADGGKTWYDLPAEDYTVSYKLDGTTKAELKEIGSYGAYIAASKDSVNYTGSNGFADVEVSDAMVFADVPSDAYYAQSVYDANKQGYIYGMGGTNLFAPNNSISRADMAVMIFRMAGGELEQNDGKFDVDMSYLTKFEDCDENAYYAKAVAWATQVGVVSGYDATHFGPADSITTEQFAAMLANYARVSGRYEKVDTEAVLDGVSDGDAVSAFAREQVAWAVENGYIAQGGAAVSPQADITRGRAVTIAVRFQPEVQNVVAARPGDAVK